MGNNPFQLPIYGMQEEENPFISGQNLFTQALDVINTPQQALFGAAQALGQGANPLSGAMQGMRTNMSFEEFLPEDMAGRGIAGLAGDILLDPINLLPVGALAKLLRGGLKGLEATQHGAQIIASARKNSLLRALVPGLVHEDLNIAKQLAAGTSAEMTERKLLKAARIQESKNHIAQVAKDYGYTQQRMGEIITDLAEQPEFFPLTYGTARTAGQLRTVAGVRPGEKIPESFYPSVDQIIWHSKAGNIMGHLPPSMQRDLAAEMIQMRKMMDDILLDEVDAGLATLKMNNASVLYVTHAITDEFKKVIRRHGLPGGSKIQQGRLYDGTHGYQLARHFQGKTIEELNTLGAIGQLPGYDGIIIKKAFETDPIKIQWMRAMTSEQAIADVQLFSRAAAEIGRQLPDVTAALKSDPSLYRKLSIAASTDPRQQQFVKQFGLDKLLFHRDAADFLDRRWYAITAPPGDPRSADTFLKYFDDVQSRWKGTTLAVIPAYHLRNVVGNVWNNWLGGLWDPRYYAKAMKVQKIIRDVKSGKVVNEMVEIGGIPTSANEIRRNLTYLGVTDQFKHYMAMGLEDEAVRFGQGALESAKRFGKGKFVAKGFAMGGALEDNARIAHYLWALDNIVASKGGAGALPAGLSTMDHIRAALSVKKFLFNYQDLTDLEKGFFRRVMPFYAWSRNNIPLQLEMIVNKPYKFQPIGDFINFAERKIPRDAQADALAGEWIKESTGIPVRTNADGDPEYMLLGGWIPSAEIARLGDLTKLVTDQLSPIFKVPIEQAVNKDFMFNRELERFPGEASQFLGVPLRKRYIQVLRNVRLLAEFDRLVRTEGFAQLAQSTVGYNIENQGQSAMLQGIRFFFGAKTYPLDVKQARRFQRYQMMQMRRELRRQQRRQQTYNVDEIMDLIEKARKEPGDYGF